MYRALTIERAPFSDSLISKKPNFKLSDLVRNLKKIESCMLIGDMEFGLSVIRELIEGLHGARSARWSSKVKPGQERLHVLHADGQTDHQRPLRIFTMGRFSVVINNKPIVFRVKAQKKPMDLLKTIIALGGRGIAKSQLAELLWPDSAGDASVSVVNTTLSRLRKLIGKEAVHTENGRISLNPNYCWVDCWEFEHRLNAGKNPQTMTSESIAGIFNFYQGPFLAGEDHGWLVIRREKLRYKLLYVLFDYGKSLMRNQQFKPASDIFVKCIDIDDLNEEYYLNLMQCQIKLNQASEAVLTYRRCHKTVSTLLGTSPSTECQKLYMSALDD